MKRCLLFVIPFIFAFFSSFTVGCDGTREEIMKLHREAIVFDAHCDTAMRLVGDGRVDLAERGSEGHLDLPRAREGGLDAQIFAVWIPPQMPQAAASERAHAMIDAIQEQARKHPEALEVALKGADVRRIIREGKLAAIIGIEGGHIIGGGLDTLRDYYARGARCMTLTWMNTNEWADSSDDTARWGGLNDLGRSVVREMDRLGMIIDCAHVSEKTLFDVLETTKSPVLISHSCMRAITDIPRNVSDDVLRAVKSNGGVVCVNFFSGFLDADYHTKVSALWTEYRERTKEAAPQYGGDEGKAWEALRPELERRTAEIPAVPLSRLIDHIDHAVKIAGIDHVGFGSDFDGISSTPVGLDDVSKLPLITAELRKRGYSDKDIGKILGGNLIRLVEKVMR
ncbi:MAG: dipeptidase [Candidatus Krumholzibacteria bacterium]|nr:dipeptidase [Candidatus Krumholzibacteria bacterium]